MSIAVRMTEDKTMPTDVALFDHVGREIPFQGGVLTSNTLSDNSLRQLIMLSPLEEGAGEAVPTGTSQLPAGLPFTLGS
jgi:hypothetical protein